MDSVLTHKTVKQIFVQPANLKQAVVANPEQAVVNKNTNLTVASIPVVFEGLLAS